MSKYEQLLSEIYKVDGDWTFIGKHLQAELENGNLTAFEQYFKGVSDVVYLKGCPRKIRTAFENISSILK